jgi:hypothetical protein
MKAKEIDQQFSTRAPVAMCSCYAQGRELAYARHRAHDGLNSEAAELAGDIES